jgi:hypothetical protein
VTMRRVMICRVFAASVAVVVGCLLEAPASAAQITAVPSIALEGGWDSNIFNVSDDEQSDTILRAIPGLALYFDAFQTKTEISARFEFEWYADNNDLADNPATIELRLAAAEPMRITPRLSLSPFVGYLETTDSLRRTQLISAPEPGIPPSNQIITGRSKSRDYRVGFTMKYLVSPRVDFNFGGGATITDYLSDSTDQGLDDSRTIYGDTSVEYRFNTRFSSGVYFRANYDTYDISPDSQTIQGGLQGTYRIEQYYTLSGRVGAAHSQQDAGPTNEDTSYWSPTASVSFNYSKKYFSATLAASTEPTGGSGFGVITDQLTVYLSLTDQFAERWWWDLSGSYQRNKSIDEPTDEKIDTFWGGAGIRYTATKWASLYVKGDISHQTSSLGAEGDIDRQTVYLGVTLSTNYIF